MARTAARQCSPPRISMTCPAVSLKSLRTTTRLTFTLNAPCASRTSKTASRFAPFFAYICSTRSASIAGWLAKTDHAPSAKSFRRKRDEICRRHLSPPEIQTGRCERCESIPTRQLPVGTAQLAQLPLRLTIPLAIVQAATEAATVGELQSQLNEACCLTTNIWLKSVSNRVIVK